MHTVLCYDLDLPGVCGCILDSTYPFYCYCYCFCYYYCYYDYYYTTTTTTVTVQPQHMYADDKVANLQAQLDALQHDKGKGKGKGKDKDKDPTSQRMPSGWMEKCAALMCAIEDEDMEKAIELSAEYMRGDTMQAAVTRHRARERRV